MAKTKYYAIRKITDKDTGNILLENEIMTSGWSEVEALVKGRSAEYKGFSTLADAEAYIDKPKLFKAENADFLSLPENKDILFCFSDGSFSEDLGNYSFGLACINQDAVVHLQNGIGNNASMVEVRQVAGEMKGAMSALLYAKKQGWEKVVILYDYLGIAHHATGEWKRKTESARIYYNWMQTFFIENANMQVIFQKVDAHTGFEYNELADILAKKALGIDPLPKQRKIAEKFGVAV